MNIAVIQCFNLIQNYMLLIQNYMHVLLIIVIDIKAVLVKLCQKVSGVRFFLDVIYVYNFAR